jgi:hypothetical protein
MLREVARRVDELARELERQAQAPVLEVEVELLGLRLAHPFGAPAPDEA